MIDDVINAILPGDACDCTISTTVKYYGGFYATRIWTIYYDEFELTCSSRLFEKAKLWYRDRFVENFSSRKFKKLWEELSTKEATRSAKMARERLNELTQGEQK